MTDRKSSVALRIATTCLFLICLTSASQWVMNRFVLYHAQNRLLQPSDYTVRVIPAGQATADAQLSEDGQYAVTVTTVGTSHAMPRVHEALLPVFLISAAGLIGVLVFSRRANRPIGHRQSPVEASAASAAR